MMPSAKTTKANGPAIGRSASAAWAEVWMSVTPWACRVAAVVDDDEQGDEVGEAHADVGVDADAAELGRRLLGRALQRLGVGALLDLLDLLLGLPEEQVGADRGAEDRDHHGEIVRRRTRSCGTTR